MLNITISPIPILGLNQLAYSHLLSHCLIPNTELTKASLKFTNKNKTYTRRSANLRRRNFQYKSLIYEYHTMRCDDRISYENYQHCVDATHHVTAAKCLTKSIIRFDNVLITCGRTRYDIPPLKRANRLTKRNDINGICRRKPNA